MRHYSGLLLQNRSGTGQAAAGDTAVETLSNDDFELLFVFSKGAEELPERPWEWHESRIDIVKAGDNPADRTFIPSVGGGLAPLSFCADRMPQVGLQADGGETIPLNGIARW
jgi:hypothetical protein